MTSLLYPATVDVYEAQRRLAPHLRPTPLVRSEWLSSVARAEVHLKVESLLPTRSFKIRGALNAVLKIADRMHAGGGAPPSIVTASAGNHGHAVALAARQVGLRTVVFTPAAAPDTKKAAIRRHGAELRDHARDYDAAERDARAYAAVENAVYLSPYNHRDVIAGAGTSALEILDELPSLDTLVVPIGGGGLASGIAIALKAAAPQVAVIGVEVEASTPFTSSLARGAITEIRPQASLADGLTGNLEPGSITFNLVRRYVDRVVVVGESAIQRAIRGLAEEDHLIAEGAGAIAAAAVLAGHAVDPGHRAVVIMSGGNINLDTLISVVGTVESPHGWADSAPGVPTNQQ